MYLSHFGLAEAPFSIAPDPRYLYMSQRHQEALAHLLYGLAGEGGFVLLTGEVGAGKTTICRCLLEQLPESCDLAYIFNPKLSVEELLSTLCVEFAIACPPGNTSIKVFIDAINAHLLAAHARGRNTVLIIDEAQNLSADVLEQMRLLTNLETSQRKLLQIILIGQPELATILAQPALRQLAQRIVARDHLGPLSKSEVAAYVAHRLSVAGAKQSLFPAALMGQLHRLSAGVPRVINLLCDRALLGAYTQGAGLVRRATLRQAAREVFPAAAGWRRALPLLLSGLTLLAVGAVATAVYQRQSPELAPAATAATTPATSASGAAQPIAPASAPATTLEWPAGQPRGQSQALAYAALLRAWGVAEAGSQPCRQVVSLGLRCRSARGGLDEIRQLNRPAILKLRDLRGEAFYATLSALDDRGADFVVGNQTRRIALGALAAQWSGEYTLLWRVPADVHGLLRPGESGPAVAWLAGQLAGLQDTQLGPHSGPQSGPPLGPQLGTLPAAPRTGGYEVYDAALVSRLKQFQFAQGLLPDGNFGVQTQMRLSNANDRAAPTLLRAEAEK